MEGNRAVLTTSVIATRLGYSEMHIRRMCDDGLFPNAYRVRPGGHWRIPEADVIAFIQSTRPKVRAR